MIRTALFLLSLVFLFWTPIRADALLCTPILGCSCTVTAEPLAFDSFSALAGPQEAEGEVKVDCTGVIDALPSIAVRLNAGQNGAISNRRMQAAGGYTLAYNIYTTGSHGTVWGDGTGGSAPVTINGGLLHLGHWNVTRTVHGLATPTITTRPGSYSDQVVVRIDW